MTATLSTTDRQATAVPGRFRLTDVDPEIGRRYVELRFRDLPGWVADVVLAMGVNPGRWNALVEAREVLELPELEGWHTVPRPRGWVPTGPTRPGWPGGLLPTGAVA